MAVALYYSVIVDVAAKVSSSIKDRNSDNKVGALLKRDQY
jgi:hypothetical protein